MGKIQILSPVSLGPTQALPLAPGVATLAGARLGIRGDRAWRSFEIFADEVEALSRARSGVADVVRFDACTRIGSPEFESQRIVDFASGVDAAIVGLGT